MEAAGFATFLIDAQHGFGRPPNFMTDADVGALEGHILVRDTDRDFEEWDVDRLVLPVLERIIRSHARSFSYVLKIGAHFPYSVRFPRARAWFHESDVSKDYGGSGATTISEYLNALRFGVDEFARELVVDQRGVRQLDRMDGRRGLLHPHRGRERIQHRGTGGDQGTGDVHR